MMTSRLVFVVSYRWVCADVPELGVALKFHNVSLNENSITR